MYAVCNILFLFVEGCGSHRTGISGSAHRCYWHPGSYNQVFGRQEGIEACAEEGGTLLNLATKDDWGAFENSSLSIRSYRSTPENAGYNA